MSNEFLNIYAIIKTTRPRLDMSSACCINSPRLDRADNVFTAQVIQAAEFFVEKTGTENQNIPKIQTQMLLSRSSSKDQKIGFWRR